MQQKYVYAYNGIFNWFRGFLVIPQKGARLVNPYHHPNTSFIWRNHFTEGYNIGQAYLQQPMDLSNYVFIRTRERLLLENKVNTPQKVLRSGKANYFTKHASEKSLANVTSDLSTSLPHLANLVHILEPTNGGLVNLPVAFASNTLYALERNGVSNGRDKYEGLLLPVLRAKAEHLHAEGVSQAVWALANAEITHDVQLWTTLKNLAMTKDFAPVIVKNERWSTTFFTTTTGSEHFFESELNEFADSLFFQGNLFLITYLDQMNLFELYNGLQRAN